MPKTYRDIVKASRLYPVLVLEHYISHHQRRWLLRLSQIILLLFLLIIGVYWWSRSISHLDLIAGLSALYLFGVLSIELLDVYFRSYYFGSITTNIYHPEDLFTFTVGRIIYWASVKGDFLQGFLASGTGQQMMRRAGISPEAWGKFLESRRASPILNLAARQNEVLRLRHLIDLLLAADPDFSAFLFKQGVRPVDFLAIADWVVREIELRALTERWWSRTNLARIPSLAADWAYGAGYFLQRFSRNLLDEATAQPSPLALLKERSPQLEQIESVLLRSQEANVLLVGEAGQSKMELVWQLARQINGKQVNPALVDNRLMMFNTILLLSSVNDGVSFENTLLRTLNDATASGKIILVIDNLVSLARTADQYNVDLANLLDPFLSTAKLPLIALADTGEYHQILEPRVALVRRFEVVKVETINPTVLLATIEDQVIALEAQYGVHFTYQALREVVSSAERYFQGEAVSDQATDILIGLISAVSAQGERVIDKRSVWSYVEKRTGIPLGEVSISEREALTKLDEVLATQVIGQPEAVKAVASAIKRNRAGVRNPKRPAGSFLFLGPTGVGKTETAKALATVLFQAPESLLRLDMSEYQGDEALSRLIGSYQNNKPGLLANLIREHPYGVLLLDEFEKTSPEVLNLFLQILDEGVFSDAAGKRINARNLIFIATSNAGADLIWRLVEESSQVPLEEATLKGKLINHLVANQLFKPELLNRFDGVVVFKPLSQDSLQQIAKLMLVKLADRLREQSLELVIDDELLSTVVSGGYSQQFGARPMNRYLQEVIEQAVANQLIAGEVGAGDKIVFRAGTIKKLPS